MDKRTIKIRELRSKLTRARDFIRSVALKSIELEDGVTFNKHYWGKEALYRLEETKE